MVRTRDGTYRWRTASTDVEQQWITTPRDAVCYKNKSVDGNYSATFPSFRKATPWLRQVQRLDGKSFRYKAYNSSGNLYLEKWGDNSCALLTGSVVGGFGSSVGIDINLVNRARTEAKLKLQNMKVNLGTSLGEARQTINMVSKAFITLTKTLMALRRGNISLAAYHLFGPRSGAHRNGMSAANAWLSWSYGWLPLINDIEGGIEQIQTGFRQKNLLFNVTRTVGQPMNPERFAQLAPGVVASGKAEESVKVSLWGSVRSSVAILSSLGLTNPLAIAWELTPYSFVLDWLVPVGNWLQALNATVGIEFVDGSETRRITADVTLVHKAPEGVSYTYEGRMPEVRNRVFFVQRLIFGNWPSAFLYFKNPLSTSHLTSAIALARQRS